MAQPRDKVKDNVRAIRSPVSTLALILCFVFQMLILPTAEISPPPRSAAEDVVPLNGKDKVKGSVRASVFTNLFCACSDPPFPSQMILLPTSVANRVAIHIKALTSPVTLISTATTLPVAGSIIKLVSPVKTDRATVNPISRASGVRVDRPPVTMSLTAAVGTHARVDRGTRLSVALRRGLKPTLMERPLVAVLDLGLKTVTSVGMTSLVEKLQFPNAL